MYGADKCQNCGHKLGSDTILKWAKVRCPNCDVKEANKTWQGKYLRKHGEEPTS